MNMKRTAWLVSIAIVLNILCLPSAAGAEEKLVYSSLDAWYEPSDQSTENTYNGSLEWKWERKDSGQDWFAFVKFHESRQSFGMTPKNVIGTQNRPAGAAWTTNNGSSNHPAVGKGWMLPYAQKGKPDNAVSRCFTAPKSGVVSLYTEDGYIYGGSNNPGVADNRTAFIRITQNGEQIWPEAGESVRIPETSEQAYKFEPFTAKVSAGDKLRFEVYNGDDNDSGYGKYVYWIPVITYIYEPVSITPAELSCLPLEQVFTLTFADELEAMDADCISISNASVKSFSQSSDKKSISFSFDGLKGNSEYTVTVNGISPLGEGVYSYIFTLTTEEVFEYPVYESDAAWSDVLTADNMKNDDPVWRWLYKNDATKDTLTPYVPYTLTAQNYTQNYCKPAQNEDGSYDYETVIASSSSSDNRTRVYCDSQTDAYMRNSMGRWWMRLSVATQTEPKQSVDNEIVKAFTAPETGRVSIYAKDLGGASKIYDRRFTDANVNGAALKIIKKTQDGAEEELWSYTFKYTAATVPESGLAEYDFQPLETDIQKGESLWFTVSGEAGGSAYSKQVFWNPVVEYTALCPNITAMSPENGASGLAPNFEQKISFDYQLQPVSTEDIEIDGGARAERVWLSDGGKTLCISFSGLKTDTQYNVKLHNIRINNVYSNYNIVHEFSFTTGSAVQTGEIYLENGTLAAGSNTICADINNSAGASNPVSAALLASVCRGTEANYEIVSAKSVCRDDIGENDMLCVTVELPEGNNYFIKAVLLESISSARALLPIKLFGGEAQ